MTLCHHQLIVYDYYNILYMSGHVLGTPCTFFVPKKPDNGVTTVYLNMNIKLDLKVIQFGF